MDEAPVAQVGLHQRAGAASVWLDLFRWAAAWAVLFSHVSHRVFVHFKDVPHENRSALLYLVGGASAFGQAAVVVFFVLSGYLVGGTTLRRYRASGLFDWRDYLLARLTRLWIVLVPVLVVTRCLLWAGEAWFNAPSPGPIGRDLLQFGCNALFLQTALCGQYGGNGALWSLFNEFWYYLAWPGVMIALWSRAPWSWARAWPLLLALGGLAVLTAVQFTGANLFIYFSIWLLGVAAADRARPWLPVPVALAAGLFVASLVVWRLASPSADWDVAPYRLLPINLLLAVAFANLLIAMRHAPRLPPPPLARVHEPLAGFSFTLYCLHTPVIEFVLAGLTARFGWGRGMMPIGARPFLVYAAVAATCVAAAYLLSLATERHTAAVRRLVARRLVARNGQPVPS